GGATAATFAIGAIGVEPLLGKHHVQAAEIGPQRSNQRRSRADQIRKNMAQLNKEETPPQLVHPTNDDEDIYPNKIGSYSKGLLHQANGEVVLSAYQSLTDALRSGNPEDFDAIQVGGNRGLTNPQAGLAFEIEGGDAHSFVMPPAPAFASRETAAEIAENYWMALLRDVPFVQYSSHPIASAAAADLTLFGADAKVAKDGAGQVTPELLFRGLTPGDKTGPYLSQFFYLTCFFGANEINQRIRTVLPGIDYITSFDAGPGNWLDVQRGISPPFGDSFDPVSRYIRNGRDLGQWVHIDVLFQAYFHALLILFGLGAPEDADNPYAGNPTQIGFGTFGGPHIATLLCEVSTRALHAVWFQKWFCHRRLRPEVFAARVDRTAYHGAGYPVHAEILNSINSASRLGSYLAPGSALLPQAYPEGSPTHPSYGAGHATVAGACTTILKAWFDQSSVISNPVQPSDDGLSLAPYTGPDLTVGGELNKIASNVAHGRNIAGIHWRSDGTESLKLGEAVAIQLLKEQRATYNENFSGFSLTKFDGTTVTV
ncbi:MAG TPA: vanadium-dependent haloperoxidase, partial [Pyrinomonadaceae bacterium]|nr:vanadium-dependent haloperoxidase [Pyrinomonadaceae bacterium]